MGDLKALNKHGITPHVVLNAVGDRIDNVVDIFVVTVRKDGQYEIYSSGDMKNLSSAALLLQDLALMHLQGRVLGPEDEL